METEHKWAPAPPPETEQVTERRSPVARIRSASCLVQIVALIGVWIVGSAVGGAVYQVLQRFLFH